MEYGASFLEDEDRVYQYASFWSIMARAILWEWCRVALGFSRYDRIENTRRKKRSRAVRTHPRSRRKSDRWYERGIAKNCVRDWHGCEWSLWETRRYTQDEGYIFCYWHRAIEIEICVTSIFRDNRRDYHRVCLRFLPSRQTHVMDLHVVSMIPFRTNGSTLSREEISRSHSRSWYGTLMMWVTS